MNSILTSYYYFIANRALLFGVLISVVANSGCTPKPGLEPTNSINSVFQPYVEAFLNEAKARNIKIPNGFSMQFENLKGQAGGAADYSKNAITIDSIVWRNSNEEYRQVAVFHELGHLLLDRGHNLKRLANGEVGSIMYSLNEG